MIWIILGCCWVSQISTKPGKNIWGPSLDSITSYYVQCPCKIVSFFQVFRHLNYHILVFFPAYIGLYWTPAGWYGQKPYLGPAHMWLRQNMAVCDAELGPKWGGVTNTRFTFLASYVNNHRIEGLNHNHRIEPQPQDSREIFWVRSWSAWSGNPHDAEIRDPEMRENFRGSFADMSW